MRPIYLSYSDTIPIFIPKSVLDSLSEKSRAELLRKIEVEANSSITMNQTYVKRPSYKVIPSDEMSDTLSMLMGDRYNELKELEKNRKTVEEFNNLKKSLEVVRSTLADK